MDYISIISSGYRNLFGDSDLEISALPPSGSDRKYFRISLEDKSVIGAYNPNEEENKAFIGFTNHFILKGLPVPEIYGFLPENHIYFLRDLGDTNLYSWIQNKNSDDGFDQETEVIFRKIIDKLIIFQTKGITGLNLDLCYPHKSFDRQSMMWDMNYFKYMFLKLISVPFNEKKLENDFEKLADFLLAAGQDYFLYRDFQSANVMIVEGEPWFIDYQGGRKGAPQYDLASLLYDAKISMQHDVRERLMNYYIEKFCAASEEKEETFKNYYPCFTMIRLMQALGAFGFRGLYENKPTFTDSIVPAVRFLEEVSSLSEKHIALTELQLTIKEISKAPKFKQLVDSARVK